MCSHCLQWGTQHRWSAITCLGLMTHTPPPPEARPTLSGGQTLPTRGWETKHFWRVGWTQRPRAWISCGTRVSPDWARGFSPPSCNQAKAHVRSRVCRSHHHQQQQSVRLLTLNSIHSSSFHSSFDHGFVSSEMFLMTQPSDQCTNPQMVLKVRRI